MNKLTNWINEGLSGVGVMLGISITETKEVLGLVLVILNILVLISSCVIKAIQWNKDAKADGRITKEELNELEEIIKDTGKQLSELQEQHKETNNNE